MSAVKIVIIGGGSYMWTPTIVKDILLTKKLAGSTIVLHDINAQALNELYRYCSKMRREFNVDFKIKKTLDKHAALEAADYVVVTISVGGFDTMQHDLDVPLKYGIYQSVGDTIGPGGLSRALRSIPVFIDFAKTMEQCCPDAWLINYTNPMSTIVRAVTKQTRVKTIGLCHELFPVLNMLGAIFGDKNWRNIPVTLAGVNHLAWILDFVVDGKRGMADLLEMVRSNKLIEIEGSIKLANKTHRLDKNRVKFELLKLFGALPAVGDRHIVEFFPYFLTDGAKACEAYNIELTTIEIREKRWLQPAREAVRKYNTGKKKIARTRSKEAIADIITSLATGRLLREVVNLPNRGQIPELPLDAVVETMAMIEKDRVTPLAAGRLPKAVLSLCERMVKIHELTVEAALTGDREKAFEALLLDPLTKDFNEAGKMLGELLQANKEYLPQFFPGKRKK